MSEQELNMKFAMFEQQIQAIQQQLQAVEQAILDLTSLNVGMGELVSKKGSEIMAPIGRGIYAKAKLLSEDLLVDIGGKNFVKKSIPETKKLIEEQIKKLREVQKELDAGMRNIEEEVRGVFEAEEKVK